MSNDQLRIMIYGAESLGYSVDPDTPLSTDKYILTFCPVKTDSDFSEFDVVIFFERLFETIQQDKIICSDEAEMLKRAKQISKLIKKGGRVCSLFYDMRDTYVIASYMDAHTYPSDNTNLTKMLLNDYGIDNKIRKSTKIPLMHFKIYRNEYKKYLEDYGVCQTYFQIFSYAKINFNAICGVKDNLFTGMIIEKQIFILPCHAPDKNESATKQLFLSLVSALYESISKLSEEIPLWVDEGLIFPEETKLVDNQLRISKEIIQIESKMNLYKIFKGCLCQTGDALVESVSTIFESFFKLRVVKTEEYIEDIKLYMPQKGEDKMIAVGEIKGGNSGITRQHINQADSHRERLELPNNFPSLLIVNTKMDATDFKEKELEVASEQIKKAVSDNVLIMRTLDLVNIVYLIEKGIMTREKFISLIQTENGWMKATREVFNILKA